MLENLTYASAHVNGPLKYDLAMIELRRSRPYEPAMFFEHPHGYIVGVRYDQSVPERALKALPALERDLAAAAGSASIGGFVAGRMAMHAALEVLGCRDAWGQSILRDSRGAPVVPDKFVGSLSHKDGFAFAIASRANRGIGIDVESINLELPRLASRALCEEEVRKIDGLAPEEQWRETIRRFSIKEATYKAIDRYLCRKIELQFKDVLIKLPKGSAKQRGFRNASVKIRLQKRDCSMSVDATYALDEDLVLSTAQVEDIESKRCEISSHMPPQGR